MLEAIFLALNLMLLIALVSSAVEWVRILKDRWGQSPRNLLESILPSRPRDRPFWNPVDALVMLGSLLLITQLLVFWMISKGWMEWPTSIGESKASGPESLIASTTATSIAGLASVAIVLGWLRLFDRDAHRKLGLTCNVSDAWLGLRASLLILPPVLLISAAVAYYIPYEHPVLKSLAGLSSPAVFAATFLGTAIVTPLVEELLVRGLLQGGLQGFADRRSGEFESWRPQAFWPIIVASLIFSSLHIGQGAAPIPLFFLSLGLGYLYRQTGSLAPPIIVHMVLNGLTLIAEVAKPAVG
jgi:membrane protease YdiL (CAAX protease family)